MNNNSAAVKNKKHLVILATIQSNDVTQFADSRQSAAGRVYICFVYLYTDSCMSIYYMEIYRNEYKYK